MTTARETVRSVTSYLAALAWDGTPRADRWLVEYAGAGDSPYVRGASRAMLVAAVRRARRPGCRFDWMPIFDGPQGCGKSAALRLLAVEPEWFADDLPLGAGTRRLMEATAGKWIVEVSELGRLRGGRCGTSSGVRQMVDTAPGDVEFVALAEQEDDGNDALAPVAALKVFLSRSVDEARMPYQHERTRVPRQFVFVGTAAATPSYLADTATSNRRLWPIRVARFDLERLARVRDQLWAEAAAAEAAGESIFLDVPVATA